MKRFVIAVIIIAIAGVAPLAASADPIALQPSALRERPAVVAVDTQNVTTITFCEPIAWSAYKAPWLHVVVSTQDKRVLLLDANAAGGETVLMVWTEGSGMPLQMLVRASAQALGNHVYTVACAAGAEHAAAPPRVAAPERGGGSAPQVPAAQESHPRALTPQAKVAAWDAFTKGLSTSQWDLLAALVASPTSETVSAFEASLSASQRAQWAPLAASMPLPSAAAGPRPQAPSGPPAPAPLPAWLPWEATVTRSDAGVLITYSLQNTGQVGVVLDSVRLLITTPDGAAVPGVSLSRQDTSGYEGRVNTGGAESGVIRIPAIPEGGVVVSWPVVAVDDHGTTYQISQRFK